MIKLGDLVRLDPMDYPQYKGMLGVIIDKANALEDRWVVMIAGTFHEYFVKGISIEVVNESR